MIDGGLRKIFRKHLTKIHWQPVETPGTGRGVPDSNGCAAGVEFWIEFKRAKGNRVDLRPAQIGWLLKRERHGGRTFIAVRQRDMLWLWRGTAAKDLKTRGLISTGTQHLVGCWPGGEAGWPWAEIYMWFTFDAKTRP